MAFNLNDENDGPFEVSLRNTDLLKQSVISKVKLVTSGSKTRRLQFRDESFDHLTSVGFTLRRAIHGETLEPLPRVSGYACGDKVTHEEIKSSEGESKG